MVNRRNVPELFSVPAPVATATEDSSIVIDASAEPDYREYCQHRFWNLIEAAALLAGQLPSIARLSIKDFDNRSPSALFYRELKDAVRATPREIAYTAALPVALPDGKLVRPIENTRIRPAELLRWARRRRFPVPGNLESAINETTPVDDELPPVQDDDKRVLMKKKHFIAEYRLVISADLDVFFRGRKKNGREDIPAERFKVSHGVYDAGALIEHFKKNGQLRQMTVSVPPKHFRRNSGLWEPTPNGSAKPANAGKR